MVKWINLSDAFENMTGCVFFFRVGAGKLDCGGFRIERTDIEAVPIFYFCLVIMRI